jgi:hypothetical protein
MAAKRRPSGRFLLVACSRALLTAGKRPETGKLQFGSLVGTGEVVFRTH